MTVYPSPHRLSGCFCETFDAGMARVVQNDCKPIAILTRWSRDSEQLVRWLEHLGPVAAVLAESRCCEQWISLHHTALSCVIIEKDFVAERELEGLRARLRLLAPELALIVLSRQGLYPGGQSLSITDKALDVPMSSASFQFGILSGFDSRVMSGLGGELPEAMPLHPRDRGRAS